MQPAGLIICGGRSSRMGTPKPWLDFNGRTLLEHMMGIIGRHASPLIIAAAQNQHLPSLPGDAIRVEDRSSDRGPMEGLCLGLRAAEQAGREAVFAAAVDLPLLEPALIPRMTALIGPSDDAAVAVIEGVRQPLCAVYRCRLHHVAQQLIDDGVHALQELLNCLKATAANLKTPGTEAGRYGGLREIQPGEYADIDPRGFSFRNINTQEDYMRLREKRESR
jgi:molybdenum cofactor guanylyltransferase